MGPLASRTQVREVGAERRPNLRAAAEVVFGGGDSLKVVGADRERGAFFPTDAALRAIEPFEQHRAARRRGVRTRSTP